MPSGKTHRPYAISAIVIVEINRLLASCRLSHSITARSGDRLVHLARRQLELDAVVFETVKRQIAETLRRVDGVREDPAHFFLHRHPMFRGAHPETTVDLRIDLSNAQTVHPILLQPMIARAIVASKCQHTCRSVFELWGDSGWFHRCLRVGRYAPVAAERTLAVDPHRADSVKYVRRENAR